MNVTDIVTKIKLAETYAKISESELARRMGVSPQSFCQRLKRGKFTEDDYDKIGEALGAQITIKIQFPDGTVFE